jgi:hypothetical protein
VPAFKPPKSKNAATTLAMLGGIAVTMFGGVTALALISHVHAGALIRTPRGYVQPTVIAQVGRAVFGYSSPLFYLLQLFTALILVLAANTAFNGFPVLASILARDGYLPRQLHTRGDRLAFSNGILLLSGFAIVLIVAFNASPTRLIQLYIVGVFVSFTCSQTGMIRHWNRLLRGTTAAADRLRMIRSRTVNAVGACVTGAVLVIVVISKFLDGAWIAVAAMVVLWLTMRGIRQHYQSVALELTPDEEAALTLPSSNIAIVLVSKLHLPTLRALAYARAARPARLEAVTVDVDGAETARLQQDWDRRAMPLPLTIVSSPYREITRPVIEYVRRLRRESPRDIVTVYVPEYVLGHWWEQALHNQSALRLKARLLLERGVVVASVPYQLQSATRAAKTADPLMGGRLLADRGSQHAAEVRQEVSALTGHDGRQPVPIAESQHRERVELAGTLQAVTTRPRGGSLTMEAELWDGTGRVTLVWLGRREIPGIEPGRRIVVHGRLTSHRGQRTIFNPAYNLHPAGDITGPGR